MSSSGELDIRQESPTSVQVTWKVEHFNDFKSGTRSPAFFFSGFECFISADVDKPGYITLSLACFCCNPLNPQVNSRLFLMSKEGSLLKIPIRRDKYHVTKKGTFLSVEILCPDSANEKEFWIPGEVLTVVCQLENDGIIPEKAETSTSKVREPVVATNRGELDIRQESPTSVQVTWKIKDFSNFNRGSSPDFNFAGLECFLCVNVDKPGYFKFSAVFHSPNYSNPRVQSRLFVMDKEGTLISIQIAKDRYHVTSGGIYFSAEIPFPEEIDERDFLIPEDVLTVVCQLEEGGIIPEEAEASTSEVSHLGTPARSNFLMSPSSVEFTFPIPEFCSLRFDRDNGILSEDFPIPKGRVFFVLFPHGQHAQPDFVFVGVYFFCEVNRGLRTPEMDCEVAVRTAEGALYRSLWKEDDERLGSKSGVFNRYFDRSEIIRRRNVFLPGGVLTLCIKLSRRQSCADGVHGFAERIANIRLSDMEKEPEEKIDSESSETQSSISELLSSEAKRDLYSDEL